MPGVPSGRGCDACRKQKKKCDTAQPSCGRCARLRLPCTGNGQRRFKFVQFEESNVINVTKSTTPSPSSDIAVKPSKPVSALSNDVTWLASSFVSGLGVKDPRFDLACYGNFLPELPKRFGRHAVLDASASALICAYPAVYNRQPSCEALTRYGKALHVLRLSLEKPGSDNVVEVLCAIYFLLICQTWIARSGDEIISHGKAVSQMLNAVAGKIPTQHLKEGFEHQVLVSMCMVVVIEATFDPTVQLHPWYRRNVMAHHGISKPQVGPTCPNRSGGLSRGSISVGTLARIPDLVHAPRSNADEIRDLYECACLDAEELAAKQAIIMDRLAAGTYATSKTAKVVALERVIPSLQVAQSILLCVALGCNAMLSVLFPWDVSLVKDSDRFYDDVIALAQEVTPYRPLGASHFPICLIAAYLAVTDPEKHKAIRDLLIDFQQDFAIASWLEVATNARESYWIARTAYIDEYERRRGHCGKVDRPYQGEDKSFCAVQ